MFHLSRETRLALKVFKFRTHNTEYHFFFFCFDFARKQLSRIFQVSHVCFDWETPSVDRFFNVQKDVWRVAHLGPLTRQPQAQAITQCTSWHSDGSPSYLGGSSHGWVPVNTHGTPVLTSVRRLWVAHSPRALHGQVMSPRHQNSFNLVAEQVSVQDESVQQACCLFCGQGNE